MAWSLTGLTSSYDNTNQQTYTTASVSPTANRWLVVCASIFDASASVGTVTVSGLSLSWSQVVTDSADSDHRIAYWMANTGDSPGSGTLTISISGSTNGSCLWSVYEVLPDNAPGASDTVSGATVQTKSSADATGTGAETVTLDSAVTSGNRCFAAFGVRSSDATALTPESGWTEVHEVDNGSENQLVHTAWSDDDTDNSYTGTANGTGWASDIALIFEMAATSATAAAPKAPTACAGTASGDSITMTFTDNTSGAAQHRAYYKRSTDSIWTQAGDLDAGETSFVFSWLTQGTSYDVGITSFDADAESAMSSDTSILTGTVRLVSGSFL